MTLNKATLIGRLGKDPEVRRLNGGDRVVSFSLATSERWKDKNGERKERTEWHKVVIFNEKLGEIAEQYLKKGSECYVEGKIQSRSYDKDGTTHYITEIVLQKFDGTIKLLGSKGDDTRQGRDDYDRTERRGTVSRGPARPADDDDDLPDGFGSMTRPAAKPAPKYADLDDDIPF